MKITKLLLLSLAVIFLSCSDDDDPLPTREGMIGAWTVTAVDYKGTTSTTIQGTTVKANFTGTGKDMNLIVNFNDNPSTFTSTGSYTIVMKTTAFGQTTTEEYPIDEIFENGTWALNGRTLTITGSSGAEEATVIEQTSTTLKMKVVVKEIESDQGISITTDIDAVYSFTKR